MELDAKLLELILKSIDELRSDIKDLRLEIKLNNEKLNNDYVKKSELNDLIDKEICNYMSKKVTTFDKFVLFSTNVVKVGIGLSGIGALVYFLINNSK